MPSGQYNERDFEDMQAMVLSQLTAASPETASTRTRMLSEGICLNDEGAVKIVLKKVRVELKKPFVTEAANSTAFPFSSVSDPDLVHIFGQ